MRTWQRSPRRLVCGRCCLPIQIGDPMLVLHSPEFGWKKARCATCAGEPAPELPPLVARPELPRATPRGPLAMTRFTADMLPLDFKTRQSARDPGEEG